MKKTLFFAVVLALLVGLLPSSMLFAEEEAGSTVELSAETVYAKPGEEVKVPISITKNNGLISLMFEVIFDDTAIEMTKVEGINNSDSDVFNKYGFNAPIDGLVDLASGYRAYWTFPALEANDMFTGAILNLTFKIADDAAEGTEYVLTFKKVDGNRIPDNSEVVGATEAITMADATGKIIVGEAATDPTTTDPTTTDPTTTDPTTTDPTTTDPTVTDPTTTDPTTTDPSVTDPSTTTPSSVTPSNTTPTKDNPGTSSASDIFAVAGIAAVLAAAAVVAKKKF